MKIKRLTIIFILIVATFAMHTIYKLSPLLGSNHRIIMPQKKYAERMLNNNMESFRKTADYIIKHDGSYVRWNSFDGNILKGYGQREEHIDKYMQSHINQLEAIGVEHIIKEKNHVLFCIWESLESSSNIVFCMQNLEMQWSGKTNIEIIPSSDNWYYVTHIAD